MLQYNIFTLFIIVSLAHSQSYFEKTNSNFSYASARGNIKQTNIYPFTKAQLLKLRRSSNSNVIRSKRIQILPKGNLFTNKSITLSNLISLNVDSVFTTYSYTDSISSAVLELSFYGDYSDEVLHTVSYELSGNIDNQFHFYFKQSEILKSKSNSQNNIDEFSYFNTVKTTTADKSSGYGVYQIPSSYIYLGKVNWSIGAGESGKLILNNKLNTSFSSFGMYFELGPFRYHSIHGSILGSELKEQFRDSLNSDPINFYLPDKFFVNHRFELSLSNDLMFHYNEALIYGNRSIDINYFNPFSFLRSQEHELHDRDNVLISLGMSWRIPSLSLQIYNDILLDEWKISEVFTDWFGNKHGIMNGLTWAKHNIQLWFEHVAIRPFTYTHKFDVNRYTHDGQNIGYFAGPNSQTFFYKTAYYPNPSWSYWLSHRVTHKGQNYDQAEGRVWNVGGDIFKGHINENSGSVESISENVAFLSGNLLTEIETQFNITYEPNYYIKTELNYTYNSLDKTLLRFFFRIQY